MSITVETVTTRRQQKQFLKLPWHLYRGDPHWIPPLRDHQREMVGYKHHPFYDFAEAQTFLALRDGQPCGRISAIINPHYNSRYKEQRGFFGFFETIDDPEVVRGLFDAAREWLAEHDIVKLRGPINPSLNYECGLLIDGFDSPPMFMMTYNPPFYGELLEDYGFVKTEDLHAFWGHVEMLKSIDKKVEWVLRDATRRFDVKLRRLDRSRFDQEVRMFLDIYNQSLGGTWGFTPLSEGEMSHMSKTLKHLIVPELTTVAEVDGEPVGAVFALLDYNPRIKKIDGRLFPFGFIRLLWNRRAIDRIRVISTNVVPKYQRWGLGLVILNRLIPEIMEWGVKEAEFSWVLESNDLSYKSLKRGGEKLVKSYRIYDLAETEESGVEG